jgi:hypothetical protein
MLQAHDWHLSGKYFYTALAFICHVAAFAMRRCIWPTSHKHLSFAGQTSALVVKVQIISDVVDGAIAADPPRNDTFTWHAAGDAPVGKK